MPNIPVPAAALGLPSNIIAFPTNRPSADDFTPNRERMEAVYLALCVSWQFAHLDQAGIDRALGAMVRMDRHGAGRMVRENAEAIRWLYEATDSLIEVDTRMQDSMSRVIFELEAN